MANRLNAYSIITVLAIMTLGCFDSSIFAKNIYLADFEAVIPRETPFKEREFVAKNTDKFPKAISYGFYRKDQAPGVKCPSEAEILEDLQIIKKYWKLIRVYNADKDTEKILKVINDNHVALEVMLGVWLEGEKNTEITNQNKTNLSKAIELANQYPKIVKAINVGNETQVFWSWHKLDTEKLINYIRVIRKFTKVAVTTADDYNFWNKEESKKVASETDFITCHIYPLWNGKTLAESFNWLDENLDFINKMHINKFLVLGEIGWATNYNPLKKGDGEQGTLIKGEVGTKAQETFLIELDKWLNRRNILTFLFEVFDEPWKGGGENSGINEIEKNWGLFYENRKPKESFINYLTNNNKH